MLAVFKKEVAKCPKELKNGENCLNLKEDLLLQHFSSVHPDAVTLNLGGSGFMAFSSDKQNPLLPRLFAVVDDIFCLFQGHIENIAPLKQLYGLTKTATEESIIVEAYRSLRDRGSSPTDHALRNIQGKFAFIIYDASLRTTFFSVTKVNNNTIASSLERFRTQKYTVHSLNPAVNHNGNCLMNYIDFDCYFTIKRSIERLDADGSVPLYWGTTSEDHLVLSDEIETAKKACGRSFALFPKGCFFTSSGGLKSYEHPRRELKAVPWVDDSGQACGAIFTVAEEPKKNTTHLGSSFGMPRVDSDADWSNKI